MCKLYISKVLIKKIELDKENWAWQKNSKDFEDFQFSVLTYYDLRQFKKTETTKN